MSDNQPRNRADEAELANLRGRDPRTWSVADVAKYLVLVGSGEFRTAFIQNDISGAEFVQLTERDLEDVLGVRRISQRKALIKAIREAQSYGGDSKAVRSHDGSSASSSSASGVSGSEKKAPATISFKGKWKGKWVVFSMESGTRFSKFSKRVQRETRCKVDIQYTDSDGDLIDIKRTSHLATAIQQAEDGKPVRLTFTERTESSSKAASSSSASSGDSKSETTISSSEKAVFNNLSDGVIVIDEVGVVIFLNPSAAELFGAAPKQILGQNIKILMGDRDAESHDFYLWRYVTKREPRIVGKPGRMVTARKFDGTTIPIHLAVNEAVATNGKPLFVGTVKPATMSPSGPSPTGAPANQGNTKHAILDVLTQAVVVVSTRGIIKHANPKFLEVTGYELSAILAQNISELMPSPYREAHDGYLQKYLETGEAKIIGKGRKVVILRKDQTVLPVHLTVKVQGQGDSVEYLGIITPLSEEAPTVKLLVAQRQVLSALPVAAVLIDERGIIQVFNPAAQTLFGYDAFDVLGSNISTLMPEPDKSKHDGYLRHYLRSGNKEASSVVGTGRAVIAQKKNGDMFPVHLSVTEHTDADGSRFFSGILYPQ